MQNGIADRQRGRPPKGERFQLSARFPVEVVPAIRSAAEARGASLTAWLNEVVINAAASTLGGEPEKAHRPNAR